jgi:hypothetical protein
LHRKEPNRREEKLITMKLQLLRPPLALSRAKQRNVATTHLEYTAVKYLEI